MPFVVPRVLCAACASLLLTMMAAPTLALDKQGSAHGGSIAGANEGIHVSGALMAGVSPVHVELSLWRDILSLGVDGTLFSDRQADNPLRPSELDLTPEVILRKHDFEIHVAYERDMPLDRSGLVQHFVYLLGVWTFSFDGADQAAFEGRGQILSP
jgi:hypothetical protein